MKSYNIVTFIPSFCLPSRPSPSPLRFSELTAGLPPEQVVSVLNTLYSAFDVLCHLHDVYKVETVGSVYMVVGGCPQEVDNHAELLAHLGTSLYMCKVFCVA